MINMYTVTVYFLFFFQLQEGVVAVVVVVEEGEVACSNKDDKHGYC